MPNADWTHSDGSAVSRREPEAVGLESRLVAITVEILSTLVSNLEARHPNFRNHSVRVGHLSKLLAESLRLPSRDTQDIRYAGLLHDIGMIAIPDDLVGKEGLLTESERLLVQKHVSIGADLIRPLPRLSRVADYVYWHHERLNGSGYPEGLKGEEIPLGAQVVGIAEAFASLIEDRPHRPGYSVPEAMETLRGAVGIWFGGRVLAVLEQVARAGHVVPSAAG